MTKDLRKTYQYERVEVPGNVIHFDGKYNPENDTLKVYRMYGDVSRFIEAITKFCNQSKIQHAIYK